MSRSRLSLVTAARTGWGGLLVAVPGRMFAAVAGRPATTRDRWMLRALGTRHLAQAAITATRPAPAVRWAGAAVDLLHAATCAGAAVFLPRWRRPGLVDGVAAAGFALGYLPVPARRPPAGTR
jgi:hypothetical protein